MSAELKRKGLYGSIEVSLDDECLHGKILMIDDLITYEANTVSRIKTAFKIAVDDYLLTRIELRRADNSLEGEQ